MSKKYNSIIYIILFVLAAFSLWEFVFQLCNMIGAVISGSAEQAVVQLKHSFPLILTAFLYTGLSIRACRIAASEDGNVRKNWKNFGLVSTVYGSVIVLYTVAGYISGEYERIIEGYPSALYPADILIGGIIFVLLGLKTLKAAKDMTEDNVKRIGFSKRIGKIPGLLTYMCALCAFAACFYGTFCMDWSHGNVFFNIVLWLNYFTAFAMIHMYRYVYCEADIEKRPQLQKKLSLTFLVINIILFALYLAAVQIQNEAPNLNAFAILPIEFTASFSAFTLVYGLNNILTPLVALIKSRRFTNGN